MKILKLFFLVSLLSLSSCSSSQDEVAFFEEEPSDEQWPGKKIVLTIDDERIGFVNYAQISARFGWYALYELYVYPKYRSRGYSKQLLNYACETLFEHGAVRIFIQPGPFEIEDEVEEGEYEYKLQKLVALYEEVGFVPASQVVRILMFPLYKIAGIPENPKFLMVRTK